MIKRLNDYYLALEASVKTDRIGEGLLLKTLNNKAIWLGGLHMAGWIEGRIPVMNFEKRGLFCIKEEE